MRMLKYTLTSFDCIIEMPSHAEIKHVGDQNGNIAIWALVYPKDEIIKRHFKIMPTGEDIDGTMYYIGIVLQAQGSLVWHVFEVL